MQKNVTNSEDILFTKKFVTCFGDVISEIYNYQSYMNFFVVPSLLGAKTLSYLPLLSYTDRELDELDDLYELAKENAFQIRVLNFKYQTFLPNDTVTMRLNIENKQSNNVFENLVKSRCRNKIRNSIRKYNYSLRYGNKNQDIEEFHTIFSATMHKHGTPCLDKKIFYKLRDKFEENIIFFNAYEDDKVVATMCILLDEQIAWYPWGGIHSDYTKKLVGYFIYWEVIKYICDNHSMHIFDFGRSSYEGSTYLFKSQFGAVPVKIDILTSTSTDVYSRYALASTLWKKLPKSLVDYLGPKLCKYLVDL